MGLEEFDSRFFQAEMVADCVVARFNDVPVYRLFGPRVEGWHVAGSGYLPERVPVSA